MKSLSRLSFAPALVLSLLSLPALAQAQISAVPSAFNFQGRLANPSGNPVPDGTYSVRFSLWDAAASGTEKWNKTVANVAVRNGVFAVTLNAFPAGTFNGNLWIEIKIGNDTALAPRTALVSVPYAMKSDLALTVPDGSLTASKFQSGVLNSNVWLLNGNSGATSGFLGTTDAQPLVFRTNNIERLRIDASGGLVLPNAYGANPDYVGTQGNFIAFGHPGASEDALSYKNNTFFFKDSPGGGDATDPNVVVGGNLGVGTDTPGAKLDVAGNLLVGGDATTTGVLWIRRNDPNTFAAFVPQGGGEGREWWVGTSRSGGGAVADPGHFFIRNATINQNHLTIAPAGNVGIGTYDPQAKLQVSNGAIRLNSTAGNKNYEMAYDSTGGYFYIDEFNTGRHLVIKNGGNVGIGTNVPTNKLSVAGRADFGGSVGIGTSTPNYTLHVNGTLAASNLPFGDYRNVQWNDATGQFFYDNSSRKHKHNITPLVDDFEKLLQAVPVTYTRPTSPDRWEIGFIAEDFDALGLKKLVDYSEGGEVEGINYEKICLYLTVIAKKQNDRIEKHSTEVNALKIENAQLQAKNDALEARLDAIERLLAELKANR